MDAPLHWHRIGGSPPEGERVYAIGDVHGRADLLIRLHMRIARDRRLRPVARTTLVYLGDYVDRGPASRQVLDVALTKPAWANNVVHLLGNHEAFFMDALKRGPLTSVFLSNGGRETLASYNVPLPPTPMREAVRMALMERAAPLIPVAHRALLESCKDRYETGTLFFCHAGVLPGRPLAVQETADLINIKDAFLTSSRDHGKFIVHGHTRVESPDIRTNRVNLDTAAYESGRLTCGVFEDYGLRFIATDPQHGSAIA